MIDVTYYNVFFNFPPSAACCNYLVCQSSNSSIPDR